MNRVACDWMIARSDDECRSLAGRGCCAALRRSNGAATLRNPDPTALTLQTDRRADLQRSSRAETLRPCPCEA